MSAQRRRTARDRRRRTHGQNLLADPGVVTRLLDRLQLADDELVVDIGAGRGALTLPLARAGAKVMAIERDRDFVRALQRDLEQEGLAGRVQLRRADLREVSWPTRPYRVVASPPYALSTSLLARLLDDPSRGPSRADLLLQWEVARKHARQPPATLRTAGWAPWWTFTLAERVPREAFRPVPAVDSAWLTVERRDPPVLPESLAGRFPQLLRPAWEAASSRTGTGPGPRR